MVALWWCALQARAATPLEVYAEHSAQRLDPRARAALKQIPQLERRLLALRGYLRSGEALPARWSWTAEEIEHYERSAERAAALAEIERIRAHFEALNPGYSLHVNTQVRSLDVQLARWNTNEGVARTAVQLRRAAERELDANVYPTRPTTVSVERFVTFLTSWFPAVPAPLAVPGLSRHGQARAYDFHIMRGSRIVASTDMSVVKSVWEREGWSAKLKAAVTAGSDRFQGPLAAPYEPWHYEYTGAVTLADADRGQREQRVEAPDS